MPALQAIPTIGVITAKHARGMAFPHRIHRRDEGRRDAREGIDRVGLTITVAIAEVPIDDGGPRHPAKAGPWSRWAGAIPIAHAEDGVVDAHSMGAIQWALRVFLGHAVSGQLGPAHSDIAFEHAA